MKLLLYPRGYADVFLPNTHPGDRGGITIFLLLVMMIGAENGRKRKRGKWALVRVQTIRLIELDGGKAY
jgi:hypothetical protein